MKITWLNKYSIILFLLVLFSLLLHLYKIEAIPPGIDNDEANKAYDAYSILKTGRDQWGDFFPLYFKGFGDFRLPVYTYLSIPSIAFFGLNEKGIRFPAILLSVGVIIGTYMVGKTMLNKKAGLAASFFLAFSPWFIGITRVGLEVTAGIFFMVWGTLFFIKGLKNNFFFILSSLFFVLSLYSYYGQRIIVPLYVIVLFLLYAKNVAKRNIFSFLATFFLFSLPIIYSLFFRSGQARVSQVIFTNDVGIVNVMNDQRNACFKELSPIVCRIFHNKVVVYGRAFLINYLAHFSPNIWFISGLDSARSVMPMNGLFLSGELLFFIAGIFYWIRKKTISIFIAFIWIILSAIPDSFTGIGHYTRFFIIYPSIQWISGYGFSKLPKLVTFLFSIFVIISLTYFMGQYFGYYRVAEANRSHYEYKPLFSELFRIENKYPAIYISSAKYDTKQYIFYLYFSKFDPYEYQKIANSIKSDNNEWVYVEHIGKWHFIKSIPDSSTLPENSLVVGHPDEFKVKSIKPMIITSNLDGTEGFYIVRNCTRSERTIYRDPSKIFQIHKSDPSFQIDCFY